MPAKEAGELQILLDLFEQAVGEKWVADDCSYLCKGLL
jgi:hypothetical protein